MIVRVLGSAAGGGVPQWNCACANCDAARRGAAPRRSQSSLAISSGGESWLLLNCSPDVAQQIESYPRLHPRAGRSTPIGGILITDANVDHLGGLAVLRQRGARGFRIRSSAVVGAVAAAQPAFAPFSMPPHRWIEAPLDAFCANDGEGDVVGTAISVRTIAVPGTTPGYDGRRRVPGAVVAYEIAERESDVRLLFAPVFSAIDAQLRRAIEGSTVAFLDGSFYSDDELQSSGLLDKPARALGHQPVGGGDGTLAQLRGSASRRIFTHVNNSNPMLDPASAAFEAVRDSGAEIAYDGMELAL